MNGQFHVRGAGDGVEVDNLVANGSNAFPLNPRHLSTINEHFTALDVVEAARAAMGGVIDLDPATTALANEHRVKAARFHTKEDDGYRREWHGRGFLNAPGGRCDAHGVSVTRLEVDVDPISARLLTPRTRPPCPRPVAAPAEVEKLRGKKRKVVKQWFCADPACRGDVDHPSVTSSQKHWWQKMVSEWTAGRLKQGVFVCFSVELFQTTQVNAPALSPLPLDFPFCVPKVRLKYDREVEDPATGLVKYVTGDSPPHASALVYLPDLAGDRDGVRRFVEAFSQIGKVVVPTSEALAASASSAPDASRRP